MRPGAGVVLEIVTEIQLFCLVFVFIFAIFSITDTANEILAYALFFVALSTIIVRTV